MAAHDVTALPDMINLGNQNESGVTLLEIDITAWKTLYPTALFGVSYVRPWEYSAYLGLGTTVEGNTLTWPVNQHALGKSGIGTLVIRASEDGKEKRSVMTRYTTGKGHPNPGQAQPPLRDYMTDLAAMLIRVENADTSVQAADAATLAANNAAGLATSAAGLANTAAAGAGKYLNPDVELNLLDPEEVPTASATLTETGIEFEFGMPKPALVYATFRVDAETGQLIVTMPDAYEGPSFRINERGYLEVIINE